MSLVHGSLSHGGLEEGHSSLLNKLESPCLHSEEEQEQRDRSQRTKLRKREEERRVDSPESSSASINKHDGILSLLVEGDDPVHEVLSGSLELNIGSGSGGSGRGDGGLR